MTELLRPEEFERRLRQIGEERYHSKHPFHQLLHEGKLNKGQVQAWVLNRFYYQYSIPLKDAGLLSRAEDPAFRREWIRRIIDQQYALARKLIEDHRDKIEAMTAALLEWETLDADQINDIMAGRSPRAPKQSPQPPRRPDVDSPGAEPTAPAPAA